MSALKDAWSTDLSTFIRAHPGVPQTFLIIAAINSAIIFIFPAPIYILTRFVVFLYAANYAWRYFTLDELPVNERCFKALVFLGVALIYNPLFLFTFPAFSWIVFDIVGIFLFRRSRFSKSVNQAGE